MLAVDKPVGPTSHDIVAIARRALRERRIGHTGTLDPFASGLLLLCVGRATRLAEFLTDLPKTYRAIARLDGSTPTDDATVDRTHVSDAWRSLDAGAVRRAFEQQKGTRLQRPSSYSARKVDGERAYDIARRGDAVDLAPTEITIYDMRVCKVNLPEVEFEVDCSSGTYVRAIARDVGEALGTGGYLTTLRRTAIGRLRVEDASAPHAIADAPRIGMLDAVAHLPRIELSEAEEKALRFGQSIERATTAGTLAAARNGELIAMVESDGERVRPRKVFPPDEA